MLVLLYQFKAKEGRENDLKSNWAIVTDAIKRTRNSLGSRLHTTEDPSVFIAYAQWPSEEVFNSDTGNESFTEDERLSLQRMKDAAESIVTLHKMYVIDDRLLQ